MCNYSQSKACAKKWLVPHLSAIKCTPPRTETGGTVILLVFIRVFNLLQLTEDLFELRTFDATTCIGDRHLNDDL
jgi:hypothetical protein